VGASGTVRAIDNLVRSHEWSSDGITLESLHRLRDALLEAGDVSRLKLNGLNPKRRPIIAGGAAILTAVFESLEIERMQRADGALREGLLYDLIGRMREEDVRSRSVETLADRCHVDWKQADRVEATALQLYRQAAETWKLGSQRDRQFLCWAAQLHEIGLDVAHAHYHRHGQYIVAHSDLYGFSRTEQQVLATLVRGHRRKFPRSVIRSLPRGWSRSTERLAILLRLAVVLHRSRSPDPLPEATLSVAKKSLELRFPEGWLDRHPLTRADLESEGTHLATGGYRLAFR
jgi:exopolyphosphatase/guanosine-5'-triphosphate,3'-diphosphate pyrophosphatase